MMQRWTSKDSPCLKKLAIWRDGRQRMRENRISSSLIGENARVMHSSSSVTVEMLGPQLVWGYTGAVQSTPFNTLLFHLSPWCCSPSCSSAWRDSPHSHTSAPSSALPTPSHIPCKWWAPRAEESKLPVAYTGSCFPLHTPLASFEQAPFRLSFYPFLFASGLEKG